MINIAIPNRVSRSYRQRLVAPPSEVFPLLCPVREADWIDGWDPLLVLSKSGYAESDAVFITEGDQSQAVWYITRHEPKSGFLEMIKITPGVTACRLTIQLYSSSSGSEAVVTYTHTSLGAEGDVFLALFTEDYYMEFMQAWEARLNHYLSTGELLGDA